MKLINLKKEDAVRVLGLLDAEFGLVWTMDRNAVHGNAITAIMWEDEDREGWYTVVIVSDYYADSTILRVIEDYGDPYFVVDAQTGWGGKREGAGRKSVPDDGRRVPLSVRVDPKTLEKIDAETEKTGLSRGQLIDLMASKL